VVLQPIAGNNAAIAYSEDAKTVERVMNRNAKTADVMQTGGGGRMDGQADSIKKMQQAAERMRRRSEQFTLEQFRAAVQWRAVKTLRLKAEGSEFVVEATTKDGNPMRLMMARGGKERRFRSAGTALAFAREMGLKEVMVEVEHYRPMRSAPWMKKRPDMSLRMKVGHAMTKESVMAAMHTPGVDPVKLIMEALGFAAKGQKDDANRFLDE
jgi:hypothetical protein